jgi:hypothetical protein
MTHALLIPVPPDIQPERFRWHFQEAWAAYGRIPDGLTGSEHALVEKAIRDAKVVQLPDGHSGPYAAVGPIPAPVEVTRTPDHPACGIGEV